MSRIVVLDTGPLGLVTNPNPTPLAEECAAWLNRVLSSGDIVVVPEIADYEIRRELLRLGKVRGIGELDRLYKRVRYVSLTTAAMRKAAELWATVRQQGHTTADPHALDGDVILAAQASFLGDPDVPVVIATGNVKHLILFGDARLWHDV